MNSPDGTHRLNAAITAFGRLVNAANADTEAAARRAVAALYAELTPHRPVGAHGASMPLCGQCRTPWPCLDVTRIASALDVDVDGGVGDLPQPPPGARRIDEGVTVCFIVVGEASGYGELTDAETRTMLVEARSDDGETLWSLRFEESTPGRPALRLVTYSDAFAAFADVPDLFEALRTDTPRTLAELRTILGRSGAWDATPRRPRT